MKHVLIALLAVIGLDQAAASGQYRRALVGDVTGFLSEVGRQDWSSVLLPGWK